MSCTYFFQLKLAIFNFFPSNVADLQPFLQCQKQWKIKCSYYSQNNTKTLNLAFKTYFRHLWTQPTCFDYRQQFLGYVKILVILLTKINTLGDMFGQKNRNCSKTLKIGYVNRTYFFDLKLTICNFFRPNVADLQPFVQCMHCIKSYG